jgi:hypothetical protein
MRRSFSFSGRGRLAIDCQGYRTTAECASIDAMLARHPAASINCITFNPSGADHWALGSRRCYVK